VDALVPCCREKNDKKRGSGGRDWAGTPPCPAVVCRGWCEVSFLRELVPPRIKTSELCTSRSAIAVATVVESTTCPHAANGKLVVITVECRWCRWLMTGKKRCEPCWPRERHPTSSQTRRSGA
jgi:hypothetical protein